MTREEAIKWQETFKKTYGIMPEAAEACDMAIEALQEITKGQWVRKTGIFDGYSECSKCAEIASTELNFCPNCGADMRGEEE